MGQLTYRQTAILVFLFVVTSSTLILLDTQERADWIRTPLSYVVQPFTGAANWVGDSARALGSDSQSDLEAELEEVKAERDKLLAENTQLRLLEREVEDLRRQLEFREEHPDAEMVAANVVGYDPKGVDRIAIINQGSNSGISRGMAVISPDYFIGHVTEVEENRARVTLAIDTSFQAGGMLQESGAEGIIYGQWQAGGVIEMRHLDPNTEVEEGELVVTSGRTAGMSSGLIVGRVSEIERDVQADTLTVQILPMIDYSRVQSVTVIVENE